MRHTVHLDDQHINGRKLLKETHSYKHGARFDNPAVSAAAPEGYMTGEEFKKHAVAKVNKFCDEHGIL